MKSSSLAAPTSDEGGSSSSSSIWGTHTLSRSAFDVRCSMFDVRCSPRSSRPALAALAFICSLFTLPSAFGQGSLTPPGPPAATMLTLTQVEPRTPISSVPVTISRPGAYYLTTNLVCTVSNAIVITANGVTLDLNGFTLSSTVPSAANGGTAVLLNIGLSDITICNGHIVSGVTNNGSNVYSGSGFDYGIYFTSSGPGNVMVSHVSVSGCQLAGIYLGNGGSTLVESSTVRTTGNYGIVASTVKQSLAIDIAGSAIIGNQVFDSQGQTTVSGDGIHANEIAQNCYGYSNNSGSGVTGITIQNCFGYSAGSYYGINGTTAINSYGYGNGAGAVGIVVTTAENCFGYSNGGGYGLFASAAENCYGYSTGATGLYAEYIANGCYGFSTAGTGLDAFIASVCHGGTSTGTALSTSHNVNSF